jgi:(2Fe-2S) ferredoxin
MFSFYILHQNTQKNLFMAIKDLTKVKSHLFLCNGASCKLLGAEESTVALRAAIDAAGLSEEIHTTKTLCNGRCKDGPIVISMPDGVWFKKMHQDRVDFFVKQVLQRKKALWENFLFMYGLDDIYTDEEVLRLSNTNSKGPSMYF